MPAYPKVFPKSLRRPRHERVTGSRLPPAYRVGWRTALRFFPGGPGLAHSFQYDRTGMPVWRPLTRSLRHQRMAALCTHRTAEVDLNRSWKSRRCASRMGEAHAQYRLRGLRLHQSKLNEPIEQQKVLFAQKFDATAHVRKPVGGRLALRFQPALEKHPKRSPPLRRARRGCASDATAVRRRGRPRYSCLSRRDRRNNAARLVVEASCAYFLPPALSAPSLPRAPARAGLFLRALTGSRSCAWRTPLAPRCSYLSSSDFWCGGC